MVHYFLFNFSNHNLTDIYWEYVATSSVSTTVSIILTRIQILRDAVVGKNVFDLCITIPCDLIK